MKYSNTERDTMGNYGSYFKALRESKGMTLREVEKQVDISNAYLSQLESGKVKQPSPITLYKLAQIYEVEYNTLMEKVGYPVPSSGENINQTKKVVQNRFGNITEDEELELLNYLKFMRNRNK